MSDHPQSATPTLPSATPWLPESAPRGAAPQPGAAQPNQHTRAVSKRFNPPTQTKRRRPFPVVPAVVVLLLVGAAGATYKYVGTSDDSGEARQGFAVQTEAFSFVLPDTPTIEPLGNVVVGIQTTGTQWTVASGSSQLTVLAMNFGVALDAATQQAAFDETINGRALQATGTILSDTWILTDVGVYERDTIVAVPEGIIHMKSYGKGAWGVFVLGPSSGSERPPGFTELIVSFSFF